jgi:hypothetical protein
MSLRGGRDHYGGTVADSQALAVRPDVGPGKHTLVEQITVQQQNNEPDVGRTASKVQAAAVHGIQGNGGPLPYSATIQQLFGRHDVLHVQAHTGDVAREGATAMGARAFASGDHVAFAGTPDLHTAAHEAAHVVQQRGGVQLKGGVGEVGDPHERHADQVADAVVQGRSVEGLLDRYAGASGDGAARATAVQRQEHPTGAAQPVIASAAATSAVVPPATAPATVHEPVDTTISDTTRVQSVEILHAEEIFADLPANTTTKKHAFNRLNHAMQAEKKAEKTAAAAKTAKANAALAAARAELTAATDEAKKFIAKSLFEKDKQLKDLKTQLAAATKKKNAAAITELKQAIATRLDKIRADVADMKHTDIGHTDDSVFSPVTTDVTHHDYAFSDGEHVRVHDHVVAYATTVPFGVDSEGPIDHAQVKNVMATAGLSESRRKILQAISGFEGGFDTVNTYDRAKVTWGFVQWTGGSHSDLTRTLTIIKQQHPEAFAKHFQVYGIDVVGNELMITPQDGSPAIKGDEAAKALMRNPRLTAVLAHAGRNNEIQKGEVQAASQLEIEEALSQPVLFVSGKETVSTTAGALITSEYGVGLLANMFVHSGSGAARATVHAAVIGYLTAHPYAAGDKAWRAGVEAAIISGLATRDSDRATSLRKQLNADPGSFR